jgi:hypothetical protein
MKHFLYDLGYNFGTIPYGKFRQFNRIVTSSTPNTTHDGTTTSPKNQQYITYEEVDGYRSMNVMSEFIPYLERSVLGETIGSPARNMKKENHHDQEGGSNTQETATAASIITKSTTASEIDLPSLQSGCTMIHIDDDDDDDNDDTGSGRNTTADTIPAVTQSSTNSTTTTMSTSGDVVTTTTDDDMPCIYMTDVEMATYFPRFDYEYKQQFKMKELLPGGTWCLMNHVCAIGIPVSMECLSWSLLFV